MKATLSNYKQSPRKVRLVADRIRGKGVDEALTELSFLDKKSAHAMRKLLESAVSNAKNSANLEKKDLVIREIKVNKGVTFKRFMPVWRGMAHPIHRTRSHIEIVLGSKPVATEANVTQKK